MSKARLVLVRLTLIGLLLTAGWAVLGVAAYAAPSAFIFGTALLQGRGDASGITIYYDDVAYSLTSPNGQFALAVADGGVHVLRVKKSGYLSRSMTVSAPAGMVTLAPTTLRMGDADDDDDVDLKDMLIVTAHYGTRPPGDPRADLNGDGEVGVADLVGLLGNYGSVGPLPWADAPLPPSGLSWTRRPALPAPARYGLGLASVNGKLYAMGGRNGSVLSQVDEFDPATGAWRGRAAMPTPRADLAVAVVAGRIYAIGGNGADGQRLATVEVYDPATDTWSERAPMLTARAELAAATLNGRVYAVGGAAGGALATVEVYDTLADRWEPRAPMPTPRNFLGLATADGRLYAVGGYNGQPLNVVEVYDLVSNSWSARANLPTARFALGVAATLDGRIFAAGGWGNTILHSVEVYDPTADTWRAQPGLPTARANLGLVAGADGHLFAVGGWDTKALDVVEEATPDTAPTGLLKLPPGVSPDLLPKRFLDEVKATLRYPGDK